MRFYDVQTGDAAERVPPSIDETVDPMQSTDEFDAASDTPTTASVQVPDTRPTYRLIREARAPKLSLRSNGSLTYQVLTDEARSGLWLRIAVNHEGGCFSDEAVPISSILDCVRELAPDAALQALSFKPAFVGRSTCNGGFLAAVLLAEGLLGRDPTRPSPRSRAFHPSPLSPCRPVVDPAPGLCAFWSPHMSTVSLDTETGLPTAAAPLFPGGRLFSLAMTEAMR